MQHIPRRHVIGLLLALSTTSAFAADERGSFGFALEVDADGIFNPTLKSVTVARVRAGSPAALAGIAAGDRIVEADGHVVAGAKAKELEPLLRRALGESVTLRLRRPAGEEYGVTLVAVARTTGS